MGEMFRKREEKKIIPLNHIYMANSL